MRVRSSSELPPLARGKANTWRLRNSRSGITPARAGKSPDGVKFYIREWNYPRSRGEKPVFSGMDVCGLELPPLARGKVFAHSFSPIGLGITPARAGKSFECAADGGGNWNYPRSRGEKLTSVFWVFSNGELPPLARGKVPTETDIANMNGITPARAGKRHTDASCHCQ